jgi:predicted NodU family carbamoyl transferase
MEFGSQPLRNRAILASPKKIEAKKHINNMTKQRNFLDAIDIICT